MNEIKEYFGTLVTLLCMIIAICVFAALVSVIRYVATGNVKADMIELIKEIKK